VSYFTLRTIVVLMETMKDFYSSTTILPSAAVATRPCDLRVNEYAAYSRCQLFANAAIKRIAAAVATSREGNRHQHGSHRVGAATRRTVRCSPVAVDTASHCR